MNLDIVGRKALVTGGSRGIGFAAAKALMDEGVDVAICARDEGQLRKAHLSLAANAPAKVLSIRADALIADDMANVMNEIERQWGELDILVNNVGGGGRWGKETVEDTPMTVWREVMDKNYMAAVQCTARAVPLMIKKRWGRVVTVTSVLGKEGGGRPWFNAAKAAEVAFMKTMALTPYLGRSGITFNCVAPGAIMIPGTGWQAEARINTEAFKAFEATVPRGRLGTVEEVAAAIVFLCSERASYITGATLVVDGGQSRSY